MISFALIILIASLWVVIFSDDALAILAELKRQVRMHAIHRTGTECARDVEFKLRKFAGKQGIDSNLVTDVFSVRQTMIIDRLGRKHACELLGEPDTTERYH